MVPQLLMQAAEPSRADVEITMPVVAIPVIVDHDAVPESEIVDALEEIVVEEPAAADTLAVHSLFPPEFSGPVYHFIELYAAEAEAGIPADRTLDEKMLQDGVIAEGGRLSDLRSIVAANGPLTTASGSPLNISVASHMGRHYRVEWRDTLGTQVYALAFPIEHLLLSRQTPSVREMRMLDTFASLRWDDADTAQIGAIGPVPYPATIAGENLYISSINTDRYVSPSHSVPIVEPKFFPLETLSNIITTAEVPNTFVLEISYIGLDRGKNRLNVPLNPLLRYFRQQGCTLFFGLSESRPDGSFTCFLMANNPAEGYCHSMRMALDPETLQNLSGTIQARLTAYIPLSRITSLFDETAQ